jgi:hypothetical protein
MECNILWLNFTEPRIRELNVDWNTQARQLVGQLRSHIAEYPNETRGTELVEELETASPKFAELWRTNTVRKLGRLPGLNLIPPIDEIVPCDEAEEIFDLFIESFS